MRRDYKKIKAWQIIRKLSLETYRLTQTFPPFEIYGLTSQIRRAIISAVANIAEGATRQHKKDYLNFLFISKASLAEYECLMGIAHDLKYLKGEEFKKIEISFEECARCLSGLISAVQEEIAKGL